MDQELCSKPLDQLVKAEGVEGAGEGIPWVVKGHFRKYMD